MAEKKRTAAELVAFHLGDDIREVQEYRYQPTRYPVAVYSIGDHYYCAPAQGRPMPDPSRWAWEPVGTYYGRTVYRAPINTGGV